MISNVLLPGSGTLWRTGANYIYNHNGNPGGVTQGTFSTNPSVNVPDLSFNLGGGNIGFPSFNSGGYNPFTMTGGNTGGSPYDVFGGGNPMDPTGQFSDGGYGNAPTGFGNTGGGRDTVLGHGASITGDAARNWFSGFQDSNRAALDEAMVAEARKHMRPVSNI